jgi:hypothetical protein
VPVERIDSSLKPGDLTFIAHTADAYVYENPRALPRVMLVTDWRQADFAALIRDGWPDVDPRRAVLLEHAPAAGLPLPGGERDGVRGLRTSEGPAPSAAPPAEILKANVLFRAVEVPAGRHTVRFRFHPFAGALADLMRDFKRSR